MMIELVPVSEVEAAPAMAASVSRKTRGRLELKAATSAPSFRYVSLSSGPGSSPGSKTRARSRVLAAIGNGAPYTGEAAPGTVPFSV